jgi:hypothetical protein
MSKLGQALIKGLQDALAYERGEIELRTSKLEKYEGTNREVAAPGGKMMRDGTCSIGAGETMGKEETEKCGERVEVTPDGKRELDVGDEALDKNPKKKTKLAARWEEIKKGLDNQSAILDLDSLSEDEQEQPEEASGDASSQPNPDSDEDGGAVPDDEQEDPNARPEWLPEGVEHEGEAEEGEEESQDDEDAEAAEKEIEEALREMGHSDAEIRHIVHGHMVPQVDPVDRAKVEHESLKTQHDQQEHEKEMGIRDEESKLENEHDKRMKDVEYQRAQKEAGETDMALEHKKRLQELEYNKAKEEASVNDAKLESEHKKRLQDLEYEKAKAESSFNEAKVEQDHKKRMLDLEYENAKKAKQLELEFKQKEYDMKLKHSEQLAQEKHKAAMESAKEEAKMRVQEKRMEMQQRSVDKKEDLKLKAKQSDDDRKLASKETAEQRAKEKAKSSTVKKSDDEADDLQKAVGWKHNKTMLNGQSISSIAHPEHGVISVVPNEAGGFDMKHTGAGVGGGGAKNLGSFKDPASLRGALTEYMGSLTGPVQLTHPKPKLSVVPNAPEGPSVPAAAPKPPVGAPAYMQQPRQNKLYDPDLSGTAEPSKKKVMAKIDAEASRGEEWRSQQDEEEPHKKEPADEDSKGEKSNLKEAEAKDAKLQLGVSSVNSRRPSKYRGNSENIE